MSKNALFVDVSSLNVMFKLEDKFCIGSNYSHSPERLVTDAQALGNFDVYLSMLPRLESESDFVIPQLSLGVVPFGVNKKELKSCLDFVTVIPGVDIIYICNSLANFIVPSKVSNYKTVLCYGDRYAYLEVKDKVIELFKVFNSQMDFQNEYEINCYGDTDLIDFDLIKSQYPEFKDVKKQELTSLIPLIVAYRSNNKVDLNEIKGLDFEAKSNIHFSEEELQDGIDVAVQIGEDNSDNQPELEAEEVSEDAVNVQSETENEDGKTNKLKIQVTNLSNKLYYLIIIICAVLLGVGYSVKEETINIPSLQLQKASIQASEDTYRDFIDVFNSESLVEGLLDLFKYCSEYEDVILYTTEDGPVILETFTYNKDTKSLIFLAKDTDTKDKFVSYLGDKYTLGEIQEFGDVVSSRGEDYIQYSVEFITN